MHIKLFDTKHKKIFISESEWPLSHIFKNYVFLVQKSHFTYSNHRCLFKKMGIFWCILKLVLELLFHLCNESLLKHIFCHLHLYNLVQSEVWPYIIIKLAGVHIYIIALTFFCMSISNPRSFSNSLHNFSAYGYIILLHKGRKDYWRAPKPGITSIISFFLGHFTSKARLAKRRV